MLNFAFAKPPNPQVPLTLVLGGKPMHFELSVHAEVETWESRALTLIQDNKHSSNEFAWLFECALASCFQSLPKGNSLRGWTSDDFSFDHEQKSKRKLSLAGAAHWLSGGYNCSYLNLDIALGTPTLLYSYKFRKKPGARQSLYVARMHQGWKISDA